MELKRILRYLKGTRDLGLTFRGEKQRLECYPDALLGLSDKLGQSTSGYAIFMFGDLISWRTKKQNHIALSSAEAEYIALSLACRELTSLNEMMRRILKISIIPTVYEDNKAAIELAKIDETRTLKHIVNLCYHYVRKEVQEYRIQIQWISSQEQIGDFFTKPLPKDKFNHFRE